MNSMNDNQFDAFFREKLNGSSMPAPEGTWEAIEAQLASPSKKRGIWWIWSGVAAAVVAGWVLLSPWSLQTEETTLSERNSKSPAAVERPVDPTKPAEGIPSQRHMVPAQNLIQVEEKHDIEKVTTSESRPSEVGVLNVETPSNASISQTDGFHAESDGATPQPDLEQDELDGNEVKKDSIWLPRSLEFIPITSEKAAEFHPAAPEQPKEHADASNSWSMLAYVQSYGAQSGGQMHSNENADVESSALREDKATEESNNYTAVYDMNDPTVAFDFNDSTSVVISSTSLDNQFTLVEVNGSSNQQNRFTAPPDIWTPRDTTVLRPFSVAAKIAYQQGKRWYFETGLMLTLQQTQVEWYNEFRDQSNSETLSTQQLGIPLSVRFNYVDRRRIDLYLLSEISWQTAIKSARHWAFDSEIKTDGNLDGNQWQTSLGTGVGFPVWNQLNVFVEGRFNRVKGNGSLSAINNTASGVWWPSAQTGMRWEF